jgi:hypothetical protein
MSRSQSFQEGAAKQTAELKYLGLGTPMFVRPLLTVHKRVNHDDTTLHVLAALGRGCVFVWLLRLSIK